MVLVGLRLVLSGGAGGPGAGAGAYWFEFAGEGRAVQDDSAADGATRPGQFHLCLCDAEHLSGVFAVPHYLVGESAGRDSLVPGPRYGRLGRDHYAGFHFSLADSVHAAVVARSEAQ